MIVQNALPSGKPWARELGVAKITTSSGDVWRIREDIHGGLHVHLSEGRIVVEPRNSDLLVLERRKDV